MNILRLVLTCALVFEQVFFPVSGLFAQDGPSGEEGGPMLEESGGPAPDAPPPSVMPRGQVPGNPIDAMPVGGETLKETPMYEESESISPLDRKIGPIRLKGAPLATFLDVVSAQSKVNFIITEGLEAKTITVFLRKTTVREALELLLRVKGLTYQRIGKSNTYVVQKRSTESPILITKIYTLNFIPLIPISSTSDETSAITSADVSTLRGTGRGGEDFSDDSDLKGSSDKRGGGAGGNSGGGGIAIIKIVQSVLSKKYGTITTDPRTNTLIITDMPEVFPQVEQIIAELDKKAPQILIEAQIVEINTDRANELGLEWGGARGEMATFKGPSRLTDYGLRPGFFSTNNFGKLFPSVESSADGKGDITPGVLSLAQLQAIFRALISKGEARYLGKPKIVAMNNKTAQIQIARDAAMGAQSTTSSAGGSSGTSSTGVERRRIGLAFKVTPQVNKEGYVTLIVQPSYTDSVDSAVTIQGATVRDPISRGASTMVRVKNGQTVVIGGMLSSTETKSVKKVPLLGYIPIVGWLFTSVSSRRTNTDLVIFVTPTILVD